MTTKRKPRKQIVLGVKLPGKPSELLTLAMKDLKKAEKSKVDSVNMDWWLSPLGSNGGCVVCLAGAVMRYSLGAEPDRVLSHNTNPADFRGNTAQLYALDYFRKGYIAEGLHRLYLAEKITVKQRKSWALPGRLHMMPYEESPEWFHVGMKALIREFKRVGL